MNKMTKIDATPSWINPFLRRVPVDRIGRPDYYEAVAQAWDACKAEGGDAETFGKEMAAQQLRRKNAPDMRIDRHRRNRLGESVEMATLMTSKKALTAIVQQVLLDSGLPFYFDVPRWEVDVRQPGSYERLADAIMDALVETQHGGWVSMGVRDNFSATFDPRRGFRGEPVFGDKPFTGELFNMPCPDWV